MKLSVKLSVISKHNHTKLKHATFDNFNITLTLRVGTISLANLKLKHIRHSFTITLFDVQNNFIKNRITTKSKLR